MEEKNIIKGKFSKSNIFVIVSLALSAVCFMISIILYINNGSTDWRGLHHIPYSRYIGSPMESPEGIGVCFYLAILLILVAIFFVIEMNLCELTVSDKRVSGKTSFGRKVDLPIDKISSVGTCIPKGITVATSSGKINFWLLVNREEVYQAISDLTKKRQESSVEQQNNNIDDLKKLKDLLDNGVITQEEFDAKKKQLLGL